MKQDRREEKSNEEDDMFKAIPNSSIIPSNK